MVKITLALAAIMLAGCATHMPTPKWTRQPNGYEVATCPAHYDVYVDEDEAMRGEDAAHCVREVRP